MKSLWFKQIYVESIINGSKKDTIRNLSARLPKIGEIINFSVGPRKPFASAKIVKIEDVNLNQIVSSRKDQVTACYSDINKKFVKVSFQLISS